MGPSLINIHMVCTRFVEIRGQQLKLLIRPPGSGLTAWLGLENSEAKALGPLALWVSKLMKFIGLGYEFHKSCSVCMKTYFRYFAFHVFFQVCIAIAIICWTSWFNPMKAFITKRHEIPVQAWISWFPRLWSHEGPPPGGSAKVQNSGHDLPKFSLSVCAHVTGWNNKSYITSWAHWLIVS